MMDVDTVEDTMSIFDKSLILKVKKSIKKFHLWHKHVFYKDTVRKEWAWGLVVKVLDVDYMGTAG